MDIINPITLFEQKKIKSHTDNFTYYECIFQTKLNKKYEVFSEEEYLSFNDTFLKLGYEWTLTIEDIDYSISQKKFEKLDLFEQLSQASVHLSVFKKSKNIVIFDEQIFYAYLETLNLQEILSTISQYSNGLIFLNTSTLNQYSTGLISLNKDLKNKSHNTKEISNTCYFSNFSQFKFSPDDFEFNIYKDGDIFLRLLTRLNFVFILIYLFDFSEILGNKILLKITGHKTFEYSLNFQDLNLNYRKEYSKIYKWVYSQQTKIEDKLGIARNILTVYLNEKTIAIDDKAFLSILSANNTYIKENISRYIEVRTKVHSQIETISSKVTKSVDTFFGNFQKSIFIFISFYLTVFVLKIYSKPNVSTILNKETTFMGLGLLGLSTIFLVFSIGIVWLDFTRIKSKYDDIKERALDLLIDDDVNKILGNDKEFKSEKKYLIKRVIIYTVLWIITLIILFNVLTYTSEAI